MQSSLKSAHQLEQQSPETHSARMIIEALHGITEAIHAQSQAAQAQTAEMKKQSAKLAAMELTAKISLNQQELQRETYRLEQQVPSLRTRTAELHQTFNDIEQRMTLCCSDERDQVKQNLPALRDKLLQVEQRIVSLRKFFPLISLAISKSTAPTTDDTATACIAPEKIYWKLHQTASELAYAIQRDLDEIQSIQNQTDDDLNKMLRTFIEPSSEPYSSPYPPEDKLSSEDTAKQSPTLTNTLGMIEPDTEYTGAVSIAQAYPVMPEPLAPTATRDQQSQEPVILFTRTRSRSPSPRYTTNLSETGADSTHQGDADDNRHSAPSKP